MRNPSPSSQSHHDGFRCVQSILRVTYPRVDKPLLPPYRPPMNLIRRSIALDPATDARLRELETERGQDEAAVLAEAVALLDSVVDIGNPDIAEDRRRLREFKLTRKAIPLQDVKAWTESWGTDQELPRPKARL